jgi:hypothetical protein
MASAQVGADMKTKRLFAAVVVCLLLSACEVTREHAVARYQEAAPCCRSLADLEYLPVAADVPRSLTLDQASPLFAFDTGRSYVAAFDLGAVQSPRIVELRSYVLGPLIEKGHVFYPDLVFLDERHVPVAIDPPIVPLMVGTTYRDASRENNRGLPARLEGAVLVEDPRVRYLVIRTTDAALADKSLYVSRPLTGLLGLLAALNPVGPLSAFIRHSPFARLVVTVRGASA